VPQITRQKENPPDKTSAPAFHLILDTCTGGEVYNLIIRGGNEGGLDGIDVWGFNIHIHDVEVTNKDECVTVKV
jgi:rhamnogalacturonan hydrolase